MAPVSEITSRCTRCGACLDECPTQAIVAGPLQYAIDGDFCDGHQNCVTVCPEGAIIPANDRRKGAVHGRKK